MRYSVVTWNTAEKYTSLYGLRSRCEDTGGRCEWEGIEGSCRILGWLGPGEAVDVVKLMSGDARSGGSCCDRRQYGYRQSTGNSDSHPLVCTLWKWGHTVLHVMVDLSQVEDVNHCF